MKANLFSLQRRQAKLLLKPVEIRLNIIVMLLTSFRYRDMRDEVRVVLHGDVIMHARWFRFRARFCISRDLVCIHWMARFAQCNITQRRYIFYKATDLMAILSLEDYMNFRPQVGMSRIFYSSVSVVNKKKCKLTCQIKNTFFQDPLMSTFSFLYSNF